MESACRWTSLEVVEYLTNKTSCQKEISKENEENDLPPVAFLGINDDKTINVNKQILYNFQYMFDEMLDSDGNRLIHIFVLNNRILQTRALLEIDPSLANCKSRIGLLPLDLVSDQFNLKLHLLRFNARHTLHGVARLGYISAAEEIIFNDSNAVHCINAFGESPLHVAAIFGQTKMIQLLIHRGANVNLENSDGWTPLDEAYSARDNSAIEILLSQGAVERKIDHRYQMSQSQFTRFGTL